MEHQLSICLVNSFIYLTTYKRADFIKQIKEAESIVGKLAKVILANHRQAEVQQVSDVITEVSQSEDECVIIGNGDWTAEDELMKESHVTDNRPPNEHHFARIGKKNKQCVPKVVIDENDAPPTPLLTNPTSLKVRFEDEIKLSFGEVNAGNQNECRTSPITLTKVILLIALLKSIHTKFDFTQSTDQRLKQFQKYVV